VLSNKYQFYSLWLDSTTQSTTLTISPPIQIQTLNFIRKSIANWYKYLRYLVFNGFTYIENNIFIEEVVFSLIKIVVEHFLKCILSKSTKMFFPPNSPTYFIFRGRCGRDLMVVGFTTTCAISAYHH
jgi:hypothetical protein